MPKRLAMMTAVSPAAATWDEVRNQLGKSFPKIGPLLDEAKHEVMDPPHRKLRWL